MTSPTLADWVRQVGGPDVQVEALLSGRENPHFETLPLGAIEHLERAEVLFKIGRGYETSFLPPLLGRLEKSKMPAQVDVSVFLGEEPSAPKGKLSLDLHSAGNPHYLMDPRNAAKLVRGIAKALGARRSAHAAEFEKRAEEYLARLEAKMHGWKAGLKLVAGKPVLTYHREGLLPLLEWLEMKDEGSVETKPGEPPSPEHLVELRARIPKEKIRLILAESYAPQAGPKNLAESTGAKLVPIPTEVGGVPGGGSYIDLFETIYRRLRKAVYNR